ncbi:peptidase T [Novipirellula artificiosorum]|uniref:Peptidase T n=1 Tax=Novipirellula artificiosorum TaxID=2528016 RepID=A0A5C6E0K9_9BACT|nr:peptidase T [Novipirellula artificiosorum]TWU40699.1 Peptidase T [Novipirellula artificiosorum]
MNRITINRSRLLDRFLRYVRIDTAADPNSDRYPSTEKQRDLALVLAEELTAMPLTDAHVDDNALVWGTVPATNGGNTPTVAFVAHLDTSPEAPSHQVSPQVIHAYAGGDISLPSGNDITVAGCPALQKLIGKTLVTSDGTTLLGGDDKAGVAIIMELAHTLIENPQLQHGDVRLLFTCDEEIGRGTDKIDLEKVDAMVAYTLDGGGAGVIDVETFSADAATVRFTGHNIHPAIAKGVMVNAMRAAADFVAKLPRTKQTPETTSERDGFIHPHTLRGGVGEATVELILRSFDTDELVTLAEIVRQTADAAAEGTPGVQVDVAVRRQYRNLREGLETLPQSVGLAEKAFENLGRSCTQEIIRGGTDGSQLTEKGLPTPNLSSGQHNIHSVTEFACLDEMVEATEHLIELLSLWSDQRC